MEQHHHDVYEKELMKQKRPNMAASQLLKVSTVNDYDIGAGLAGYYQSNKGDKELNSNAQKYHQSRINKVHAHRNDDEWESIMKA